MLIIIYQPQIKLLLSLNLHAIARHKYSLYFYGIHIAFCSHYILFNLLCPVLWSIKTFDLRVLFTWPSVNIWMKVKLRKHISYVYCFPIYHLLIYCKESIKHISTHLHLVLNWLIILFTLFLHNYWSKSHGEMSKIR